jgi:two-component system phosphate regulon sensor histidine kinase PhoR
MLSSRLFWKLFAVCAGLNLLAALVCGFLLSDWQVQRLRGQLDQRLRDAALLARAELADQWPAGASESLQQRVHQIGQLTGTRFTLIAPDGTVLADSERESIADVAMLDNHRERPEVQLARSHGEGWAHRRSPTEEAPYRYFALRADAAGQAVGYVRTSLPAATIQAQAAGIRRLTWGLVGAVFLCVLALSYWILGHILQPLNSLAEAAAALAAGDYQRRVYVANRDELGALAQSFNRMSQEWGARLTRLSQSHDRHATALGGMIEGVIALDSRQRIVLANRAAGRLFDFRPAAVEGRPLLEIVRSHALDQAVSAAIVNRAAQRLEIGRDGSDKLTTDVHVTPLPGDPCPGVVLVMQDTSELRRLESLRRDFIANVSHELKTPLSSIKACAETLRGGAVDDSQAAQRFLARIEEESDRLHRLILDMLSLARIESGQEAFEIAPIDVARAAAACVDGYRQAADAKQIRLAVAPGLPACRVRADEEGLREILDNLVDNAIKYTPAGGAVTLRWQCGENSATIEVQDTGIGIGEVDRRRVFERFYRVDKARSRELGGTGLGLAIVKHLVQSFGGKVSVESEPGQGSTFRCEVPLA